MSFTETSLDGFAAMEDYATKGWVAVHSFNDPLVMAGQGTAGQEIVEDLPQVTDVIASIGGGGLIAGIATAVKERRPKARVWGVETEGADCMARALAANEVVTMRAVTSIARTLGAPAASPETLAAVQRYVESVTVVSDADAIAAMRLLLERTKMLVEPAGSCTLTAAERLQDKFGPQRPRGAVPVRREHQVSRTSAAWRDGVWGGAFRGRCWGHSARLIFGSRGRDPAAGRLPRDPRGAHGQSVHSP